MRWAREGVRPLVILVILTKRQEGRHGNRRKHRQKGRLNHHKNPWKTSRPQTTMGTPWCYPFLQEKGGRRRTEMNSSSASWKWSKRRMSVYRWWMSSIFRPTPSSSRTSSTRSDHCRPLKLSSRQKNVAQLYTMSCPRRNRILGAPQSLAQLGPSNSTMPYVIWGRVWASCRNQSLTGWTSPTWSQPPWHSSWQTCQSGTRQGLLKISLSRSEHTMF